MNKSLKINEELEALADKILERGLFFDQIKTGEVLCLSLNYFQPQNQIDIEITIGERSIELTELEKEAVINTINNYINLKSFGDRIYKELKQDAAPTYKLTVTYED